MKKHAAVVMITAILFLAPTFATGETILVSAPLMPGENGLSCACINLSKNMIEVRFTVGPVTCITGGEIASGAVGYCTSDLVGNNPSICKINRPDGTSVSARQIKCTLSAIDALGNPMVVIPVDTKFKQ